jgi:endonuclease YncB( thermonuclease family)
MHDFYNYKCQLIRVVDGDTLKAKIDLGFNFSIEHTIRLHGISCWQLRGVDEQEKQAGLDAAAFVTKWLGAADNQFTIKSHGVTPRYNNVLADVFASISDKSLNDLLLEHKHAAVYLGKGDKPEFNNK